MLLSNSQMVVPGNRTILSPGNFTASPRSPLDMRFPSRGSSKRYDDGGIGLGIVAALEKSGIIKINRKEISSNRSNPIHCARKFLFPAEIDLSEEYTCVTRRDGMTKVYYNDDELEIFDNRSDGDRRQRRLNKSTKIAEELPAKNREVFSDFPDFLSLCCLCKKKLQGKDIYMYKGDRGFCSKECRSMRIMEDNLKVEHKSTSLEVLRSPYVGGQISPVGIFVL